MWMLSAKALVFATTSGSVLECGMTAATTLLPSQLAEASGRPPLFCALHFSEDIFTSTVSAVIPHSSTDPLVVAKTRAFADSIHITPLTLGPCFGSAQGGPYAVRKEADA